MPNVTFSHKKHALWNGCELCHPDIFPSVKKGTIEYSMFQQQTSQRNWAEESWQTLQIATKSWRLVMFSGIRPYLPK
jgi:hypothetical protein